MKKLLFSFLAVVLFFSFITPSLLFAQGRDDQKVIILSKDQTIDRDFFGAGSTVIVSGTVNGDAYVAGGTVLIDGTVKGDVLAAGGNITIRGTVHNVRVVGGQVDIAGTVTGNVTAAGGSLTIANTGKVQGSIVMGGGSVTILGPVQKQAYIGSGDIIIGSTIGSDMYAAGNVTLTSGAKVNGALTYQNTEAARIQQGASVSGKVTQLFPPKHEQKEEPSPWGFLASLAIYKIITSFILGFLLIKLLPNYVDRGIAQIRTAPWQSLLVGFIAAIISPFVLLLLLMTIIGIPLAILLGVLLLLAAYVGQLLIVITLGIWLLERFNQKRKTLVWALVVGIFVFEVVKLIPIIGWLFWLTASFMGFGTVLITKKQYYAELRDKEII